MSKLHEDVEQLINQALEWRMISEEAKPWLTYRIWELVRKANTECASEVASAISAIEMGRHNKQVPSEAFRKNCGFGEGIDDAMTHGRGKNCHYHSSSLGGESWQAGYDYYFRSMGKIVSGSGE